jgi:hypothetical protein
MLRYIELKSGHSDDGPAWIAYVEQSKTGRTLYVNGRGLMKLKGQRRGASGGNYVDMETGESFWVSGVKKNRQDRHWAGSGKILVEAAAVEEYLKTIQAKTLDASRCEVQIPFVGLTSRGSRDWRIRPAKDGPATPLNRLPTHLPGM